MYIESQKAKILSLLDNQKGMSRLKSVAAMKDALTKSPTRGRRRLSAARSQAAPTAFPMMCRNCRPI